ncbi:MAG: alanine--tRNA ligase [Bacteroidetes bacterium]|nr:alanine--tRNA ligase [Bacteroidota bacterium]
MTSSEIRDSFLKFFKEHNHTIVPSSPVVPYNDPTLLFANAGMNQFKDVFLGTGKREYSRAADTQKCIRVSGKHNDLEEVGRDTYHHTFFEMLGNWSFGDYYKKEAIGWAWELLTKVWKLPKDRLWATVYKDDEEAEQLWKSVTDIDPKHVLRFGEKDNFWEMGETGPCGPCSEIHIDRTPDGSAAASMVNAGIAEVMEIWNLVFIQYNRDETGKLTPLPSKHVDTGMGFERICAVMQKKNSNYDTDVFTPIIKNISEITNKPYDGRLSGISQAQMDLDTAMRVIADHIRTLTFAIGDGATPGNEGRGYVLRRILRRAARFGRNLGMHKPFIYQLVPTLVENMSYIFPEIKTNQDHIQRVIKAEEESFNTTLDRGLEKFEDVIKQIGHSKTFPGEDAFKLYDTFGFPLDLTELMATEQGLKVDVGTFTELMQKQKERSRDSRNISSGESSGSVEAELIKWKESAKQLNTSEYDRQFKFLGYECMEAESSILSIKNNLVILETTPFYGESGGQIGDTGELIVNNIPYPVIDTQKNGNVNIHILEKPIAGSTKKVTARVDKERRLSIMRNHSATHLLHNALRKILGTHVQQAGSFVAPDYLRFDFSHFAKPGEKELANIEALVNEKIKENIPRTPGLNNIPFEEAKKMGALMFFGDKYGERVNVIQFGNFSTEFCGGTHVNNTGEIWFFKIRSEGSVASGVRRIEAVTGTYALEYLNKQIHEFESGYDSAYERLEETLKPQIKDLKKLPPVPNQTSPELAVLFEQLDKNKAVLEKIIEQDNDIKKVQEKESAKSRLQSLSGSIDELVAAATTVNGLKLVSAKITASSMDELKSLGDTLRSKIGSGVGLLASIVDDKVQLVCVVTDDLVSAKKIEAGKVVGAVAKIVGGGGGGRPHMATAGGKDTANINEAVSQTKSIVESLLKK